MRNFWHSFNLSNSDIIGITTIIVLIITAYVLYKTLVAITKGNTDNIKLGRLQAADTKIIKLLEFHNKILEGMQIKNEKGELLTGREVFEELLRKFDYIYRKDAMQEKIKNKTEVVDVSIDINIIRESLWTLYNDKNYGKQFGVYYKFLYHLIKYINDISIEGFENEEYTRLIKAQLSEYEILFLFYNGLFVADEKKEKEGKSFKQLIEKYRLLSALNIANELFLHGYKIHHYYKPRAFGINE